MPYKPPVATSTYNAFRVLGWIALLLGLPFALMAVVTLPNKYEIMGPGEHFLDCDGPIRVYVFVFLTQAIYLPGLVLNGLSWRKRFNLIVAILCFAICLAVVPNILRAIAEDNRQAAECDAR